MIVGVVLCYVKQGRRNRYGYYGCSLTIVVGAIITTSLRLALALTPAAQDDKRGVNNKYYRSSAPTKTRAVPSTVALSQGIGT